jgi:hypothetical protein
MPDDEIPQNHPLRLFFLILTENNFAQKLNWSDPFVTEYISNLLIHFTHVDRLYEIRNSSGKQVDTVAEMLMEGDIMMRAKTIEREREVHRCIGDYTLFMTGIFPEYLKRLKLEKMIEHADFLVDYIKVGKRSYRRVSEFNYGRFKKWAPLYRKLSENFEICIAGLGLIRNDLDQFKEWRTKREILS